jgi:hypothetical protein
MFEECINPVCSNPIESGTGSSWRRTPKKFCCDKCKTAVWALRKAADLLSSIPADKKLVILELVASRGDQQESKEEEQHKRSDYNHRENNGLRKLEDVELVISANNHREINEDDQHAINDDNRYEANNLRRYKCEQLPRLRIGRKVRFCEGFFETTDPELMALVERNDLYGAQILQIDAQKDNSPG